MRLRNGGDHLSAKGIKTQVIGHGPIARVVFSDEPVFDYRSTRRGDRELGRALMLKLFSRGIFLNPMGTKLYLSIAHTRSEFELFFGHFESALETLVN